MRLAGPKSSLGPVYDQRSKQYKLSRQVGINSQHCMSYSLLET